MKVFQNYFLSSAGKKENKTKQNKKQNNKKKKKKRKEKKRIGLFGGKGVKLL